MCNIIKIDLNKMKKKWVQQSSKTGISIWMFMQIKVFIKKVILMFIKQILFCKVVIMFFKAYFMYINFSL